jgi:lipopolysaccharide transport protein LptA
MPLLAGLLLLLAPAYAARAPMAEITVSGEGRTEFNFNSGTIQFADFVLRQPPDTLIRADTANGTGVVAGSYDSTSWVLTGKVHIEHQGTVLDASSARVVFNDRLVRSIEVRDAPASFSHPTKVAGQRYQGSAETITFDGASRRVRFSGRPKFSFGSNEGDSDRPLLYDLDKGVLSSEGKGDSAARVRMTIRPGETPSIMVEGAGTIWNFNDGTIQFEQFVLRQAPATLIRAARASGSGVTAGNNDNSRWLLTDQVHVEHQEAVLDADSATVAFAARVIRTVDVRGAPAHFSHPSKVAGQSFRGRADLIAFDNEKHEVRFNEHVWYSRDGGAEGVSNKPIIYDLENRKLRSEKAGTSPGPGVTLKFPGVDKDRVTIPRTPDRGTAR